MSERNKLQVRFYYRESSDDRNNEDGRIMPGLFVELVFLCTFIAFIVS